jgi:hypothetical protein
MPATTVQTPLLEINPKVEAKDVFANLENSIKSVSNMFNYNIKDTRHIIKDIPRLFACLEDDSKMDDCCKIDHYREFFFIFLNLVNRVLNIPKARMN